MYNFKKGEVYMDKKYGSLNEQGDLGLGYFPFNESENDTLNKSNSKNEDDEEDAKDTDRE